MRQDKIARGVLHSKPLEKSVAKTIYVSPSTPFAASLKNVDKKLNKFRNSKVAVRGMGRAIHTVVQIAAALQMRGYLVNIRTLTVTAVDELVNETQSQSSLVKRDVPAVELTIRFPKEF